MCFSLLEKKGHWHIHRGLFSYTNDQCYFNANSLQIIKHIASHCYDEYTNPCFHLFFRPQTKVKAQNKEKKTVTKNIIQTIKWKANKGQSHGEFKTRNKFLLIYKFSQCDYWQTVKQHEVAWSIWQMRTRLILVVWISGTWKTDEDIEPASFQEE